MPNDNISRSIAKASGDLNNIHYEEIVYEGYGAGGIAVIVEALSDNRNRSASDVRHVFDKWGGSLGTSGCVSWMFKRMGVLIVERKEGMEEDEVMTMALDAGASDFDASEDAFEIDTEIANFSSVRVALEARGLTFLSAEIEWVPDNTVEADEQTNGKDGDTHRKIRRIGRCAKRVS